MSRDRWMPRQESIDFFRHAMLGHSQVEACKKLAPNKFCIVRAAPLSEITVLLVDVYTISHADIIKAMSDEPEIDCLITISSWSGYTREAKEYGKQHEVGVYLVSEFLGALWQQDHWNYVRRDDEGKPITHYRREAS
jgi:hypothetical protein